MGSFCIEESHGFKTFRIISKNEIKILFSVGYIFYAIWLNFKSGVRNVLYSEYQYFCIIILLTKIAVS